MPTLVWKATPEMPTFRHRKAYTAEVPHGEGVTRKVFPPEMLKDGVEFECDDFEASWYMAHYPNNVELAEEE